jgi:hypothetical protein
MRRKENGVILRCEPCGALAPLGEPRRMGSRAVALRGPLKKRPPQGDGSISCPRSSGSVTEICRPTSSSVGSVFMPIPKRMRSAHSSRGQREPAARHCKPEFNGRGGIANLHQSACRTPPSRHFQLRSQFPPGWGRSFGMVVGEGSSARWSVRPPIEGLCFKRKRRAFARRLVSKDCRVKPGNDDFGAVIPAQRLRRCRWRCEPCGALALLGESRRMQQPGRRPSRAAEEAATSG